MPQENKISEKNSEPEKVVANNIDCPKCGSQNCYVNESNGVVEAECHDCGMKQQELIECPEVEQNHKRIFVYGSLRKGLYNYGRCGEMKFVANATLKGYGLFSLGYYPAIVKDCKDNHQVIGEVYDVDETVFLRLESMERGAGYNTIEGKVELSTGELISVIFWDMEFDRMSKYYGVPYEAIDRLVPDGDWVRVNKEKGKYKEV